MKKKPAPAPQAQPDEFHGQGGEYIIDEHGKRQLVNRTQPPAPAAPSTETKE